MIYLIEIIFLVIVLAIVLKGPTLLRILSVVLLSLVISAGTYFLTSVNLHRDYHGAMNVGVADPYRKLTNYMNDLAEQKQFDKLAETIKEINEESDRISNVWLNGDTLHFHNFVEEIMKK